MAAKAQKKNNYFVNQTENVKDQHYEEELELQEYKKKKAQKDKLKDNNQKYNEIYQQSKEYSARKNDQDIEEEFQIPDTQIDDNDDTKEDIEGTISTEGSELYTQGGTLKKLRHKLKTAFTKDMIKSGPLEEQKLQQNPKFKRKDFIDECKENYEKDPKPYKLGNMYCFWYNSRNQPQLVLGPDWTFSLAELAIINGIAGLFVASINSHTNPWLFKMGMLTLMTQNFFFLLTALANPGLVNRDMSVHTESYLNKVKILKQVCQFFRIFHFQQIKAMLQFADSPFIGPIYTALNAKQFIDRIEKQNTANFVDFASRSQIITVLGVANVQEEEI
eukprot:403370703